MAIEVFNRLKIQTDTIVGTGGGRGRGNGTRKRTI